MSLIDTLLQVSHHISEYTDIIQKLREEVTALKQDLGRAIPHTSQITGDHDTLRHSTPSAMEEYENFRDVVFAHYSERIDLVKDTE